MIKAEGCESHSIRSGSNTGLSPAADCLQALYDGLSQDGTLLFRLCNYVKLYNYNTAKSVAFCGIRFRANECWPRSYPCASASSPNFIDRYLPWRLRQIVFAFK